MRVRAEMDGFDVGPGEVDLNVASPEFEVVVVHYEKTDVLVGVEKAVETRACKTDERLLGLVERTFLVEPFADLVLQTDVPNEPEEIRSDPSQDWECDEAQEDVGRQALRWEFFNPVEQEGRPDDDRQNVAR